VSLAGKSVAIDLYFRMTLNSFKHWLRQTIKSLQEYEADPQEIDCIAVATILAEARRQAVELCLPEVAKLCVHSGELFLVGRAIKILVECLQLLDSLNGPLTVKQAAKRMTMSQRKVLTR
jgi:16S rRNA G1207 methylase RsmC